MVRAGSFETWKVIVTIEVDGRQSTTLVPAYHRQTFPQSVPRVDPLAMGLRNLKRVPVDQKLLGIDDLLARCEKCLVFAI